MKKTINISQAWDRYCSSKKELVPGNSVRLLIDGAEAYPAMLDAIDNAQKFIFMESYIFNSDKTGNIFADHLVIARKRGVEVYLIVDGLGTVSVSTDFFERFKRENIFFKVYRPLSLWKKYLGLVKRNHRKLLVIDNETGFAGGMNIGDEWQPQSEGGPGWHDIHVEVKGPAVKNLLHLSIKLWKRHFKKEFFSDSYLLPSVQKGDVSVSITAQKDELRAHQIRRSYFQAIKNAKNYIYIANAYFIPDRMIQRALMRAARRGVDVRIMVPQMGDIYAVQMASRVKFAFFLKKRCRIFLWTESVLHSKTAVIDGLWATVGSYNMDHVSWANNLEVNVNAVGPELAGKLAETFLSDQKRCLELDLDEWEKRPFFMKLIERFSYLFRKVM